MHRKMNAEGCANRRASDVYLGTVAFSDAVADGETQPGTSILGGDKGRTQPLQYLLRNAEPQRGAN